MVPAPLAQTADEPLSPDLPGAVQGWTEWEDWVQWKRECALGLCAPATRHRLARFAEVHFNRWLDGYCAAFSARRDGRMDGREAWHRLECAWITRRGRSGKCYKQWLFARGEGHPDALSIVAAGTRLLLRTVVRAYIHAELSPGRTVSLDAPVRAGSDLSWGEMLPSPGGASPARAAERSELITRAARCAAEEFARLEHPIRLAWLARELGISPADAGVVRAAGVSKSVLFRGIQTSVRRMAARAREESDGDSRFALDLSLCATRALRRRIFDWGSREKSCAGLFIRTGGVRGGARSPREDG